MGMKGNTGRSLTALMRTHFSNYGRFSHQVIEVKQGQGYYMKVITICSIHRGLVVSKAFSLNGG